MDLIEERNPMMKKIPGTLSSDEQPSQERETVSSERQKAREEEELDPEEVAEEEKQDDYSVKADAVPEKVSGTEEESVTDKIKLRDPHLKRSKKFSDDFEKPNSESKSEESGQVESSVPGDRSQRTFSRERSEGLWIGGKHGEFTDFRKKSK